MNISFYIELTNKSNPTRLFDASNIKPELSYIISQDTSVSEKNLGNNLITSFNGDGSENLMYSVKFLEKLITETSEILEGKRENTRWSNDCVEILVGNSEMSLVQNSLPPYDSEEFPTKDLLQLLKDWKVFLEAYYNHAYVPLEWIKPEFQDEVKKLQRPHN